jgi:hypothetical protein
MPHVCDQSQTGYPEADWWFMSTVATTIAQQLTTATSTIIGGEPSVASSGFNADYYLAVATLMPILIIAFVIQTRMSAGGSRALRYVIEGARATKSVLTFLIVIVIALGPVSSLNGELLVLKILYTRHSGGWEGWLLTVFLVISLVGLLMLGILLAIDEAESDNEPGSQPPVIE